MAVINDVGDKSKNDPAGYPVALVGQVIPSDFTGSYCGGVAVVGTFNLLRPTSGQLYPRGDAVP